MRAIQISVDDRVFAGLERMASANGFRPGPYCKLLVEAAYASRVGAQPDPDLDAQVAAAIVLHGAKENTAAIASAVRLSEATVVRIIEAWRRERLAA